MKKKIFPFLFIIIAFILIISGFKQLKLAVSSLTWPSTTGKVISSSTLTRKIGTRHSTRHKADIIYSYQINDNKFIGEIINWGYGYSKQIEKSEAIVNKYPEGKTVEVYYNPNDPKNAVLEPGLTVNSYKNVLGGIVFMLIAILIIFRKKKPILTTTDIIS